MLVLCYNLHTKHTIKRREIPVSICRSSNMQYGVRYPVAWFFFLGINLKRLTRKSYLKLTNKVHINCFNLCHVILVISFNNWISEFWLATIISVFVYLYLFYVLSFCYRYLLKTYCISSLRHTNCRFYQFNSLNCDLNANTYSNLPNALWVTWCIIAYSWCFLELFLWQVAADSMTAWSFRCLLAKWTCDIHKQLNSFLLLLCLFFASLEE